MSFVYDPTIPRNVDAVRFLIGDTVLADVQLQDEEITYVLSTTDNDVTEAAIVSARAIAARFSKLADTRVGEESVSYSKRADQAWALADKLTEDVSTRAGIVGGGIAIEGIGGEDPAFTRDLHIINTTLMENTAP